MIERLRMTLSLPRTGDQWVAGIAALLPLSLVVGNVAFELVTGMTGFLWLVQSLFIRHDSLQRIQKHTVFWPLVFWMTGIMISRAANGFSAFELFHDLAFIRYVFFVLAIVDISKRLPVDRYLFSGVVAGVVWAALNTLCAYMLGFDIIGHPLSYYTEKLNEGQRIGAFCAFVFPLFALRLIAAKDLEKAGRLFLLVLIALSLGLLLVTKSRTAWGAAGIGIIGGSAMALHGRQRWAMIGSISIAMVVGGGFLYFTGYQRGLASMYDRFWIWERSLIIWKENPIWGVGISSFPKAIHQMAMSTDFRPYVSPDGVIYKVDSASHAHNLILQLLSCTGLWGLLSFFWLLTNATRQLLKDIPSRWLGLETCPFVVVGIGLTGWNIYGTFYANIVMFFIAWMGSQHADSS